MNEQFEFHLEGLEDREMLAVDVGQFGGNLRITSDNAGDTVDVNGTGVSGGIQVVVNGAQRGIYNGIGSIRVKMRGGNDVLNVSAINISGNLTVRTGLGADKFFLDTSINNGGAAGVNGDASIGGNVRASMGRDSGDIVDWTTSGNYEVNIGGRVVLRGGSDVELDGNGSTLAVENGDINIGGSLVIAISSFGNVFGQSEEIFIDDVNLSGAARVRGSHAGESMEVRDTRFLGKATFRLGGGDDTLNLSTAGNGSLFDQRAVFSGGPGDDILIENPQNIFNDVQKQISFETVL